MPTLNTLPDIEIKTNSHIDSDITALFNLDRYLGDALTLPYTYNEVKIKPNELCIADNVNACLFKLHYNFLYLNAQTKIASNTFPDDYRGYIASSVASTSSDVVWYQSAAPSTSAEVVSATNGTVLSGLVDGAFTDHLVDALSSVGIVANSKTLFALELDKTEQSTRISLNTKTVEDATALTFTNIRSLAINSQNRLFVCDDVNIYKFDIDALLTNNPAINNVGRFLIKAIGSTSTNIHDKDKFNTPVSIRVGKDDKVYVLDQGDKGYKVFDKDLNWILTAVKKIDFAKDTVVDLNVDKITEHVYILTKTGIIFEYDENNVLVKEHKLIDPLVTNEEYKRLVFSRKDSNVLYIITNKNVLKKFKTKLEKSIGAFRLSDKSITGETLSFIDVLQTNDSKFDYVFVGGESTFSTVPSDVGKIFKFNENISYKTIVYDTYKNGTYPLSSINVKGDEYVTSWVLNKTFYKIIYNHLLLRDNLHSKYVANYDNAGRVRYDSINYISDIDSNLFVYNTDLNNYVGINEPVMSKVVNRCLSEIYTIQESLLNMCKEKYSNKYPYATQIVEIK